MYTCYECQSNNFQKFGGFLFCTDCHVQHPDYMEQTLEHTSMAVTTTLNQTKLKKEIPIFKKNWTCWEAFNYILLGFVRDLTATGLAPSKLSSSTLLLWSSFLDSSGLHHEQNIRCIVKRKRNNNLKEKNENKRKKQKLDEGDSINQTVQNSVFESTTFPEQKTMRKMIYKKHKKFLNSQSTEACAQFAEETLESISQSFKNDSVLMEHSSKSLPEASGMKSSNTPKNRKSCNRQKQIVLTKGRILEILHIALLIEKSNIHLGDLIRFIREAHLSYAKITHFLPKEMKITKGDCTYLETLHSVAMPKHGQQRILGAEIARTLKIKEFPFPDMKSLITRYCKDLNLSEKLVDHALVVSEIALIKNICSFRKSKQEIPNYEGLAAACLVYVMKILFGLDDQTEFLLSDMAEKTNRLLNSQEDTFLFSFREWQKFIELRKTVLKLVHYPTEEKYNRSDLLESTGLIDMILKESKDIHKKERFTAYKEYFMDPEIMEACQEILTTLTEPKTKFKMDFPPSLTPLSSYLDLILKGYDDKMRYNMRQDIFLPQLKSRILDMLRVNHKNHKVTFIFEMEKYKELLTKNGFNVKNISKCKQYNEESNKNINIREEMVEEEGEKNSLDKIFSKSSSNDFDFSEKPENNPPENDRKHASLWSKINYVELSSSKDVYFIDDMTLTWELRSPRLDDALEISFLSEVFEKTPLNFQWLVREFAFLLEMTERDIYVQLYRLERAITKALVVSPSLNTHLSDTC